MLEVLQQKLNEQYPALVFTNETIEDLMVRATFASYGPLTERLNELQETRFSVLPLSLGAPIEIDLADRLLPERLLFGSVDADEPNIAASVLSALQKCPIDTRKELANSILLVGGLAMLPGVPQRLQQELCSLLEHSDFIKSAALAPWLRVVPISFPRNLANWVGASIFGQMANLKAFCITRSEYEEKGFIDRVADTFLL